MSIFQIEIGLFEVREKVQAETLGWQEAEASREALLGDRPWATKEWKQRRDAIIGSSCQKCGTTTPPFVLQHVHKRIPFDKLFEEVRQSLREEWHVWKAMHPIEVDASTLPLNGQGCPKCGHSNILHRKRTDDWRCRCSSNGIFCEHLFKTPIAIVDPVTVHNLEKQLKQQRLDYFDESYQVGKQATMLAIDQDVRYLSMKDTVTLCKRCAFVADRTKMMLCEVCKEKYHSKRYDRCSRCAGIEPEPVIESEKYVETEEEFDNNPYNQGTLLIMNVLKAGFGITVPMHILTSVQQKLLKEHLRTGIHKNKKPAGRKTPYLMWEYYLEGIVIIDVITLDDSQFRRTIAQHGKR